MAIIAPTLGDASESCVNSPAGLKAIEPLVKLKTEAGGIHLHWPNGSTAKLFGAYSKEDIERLRGGGNRCAVWAEELMAWRYLTDCWDHMTLGLRVGPDPRVVASTTPKPFKFLKELLKDPKVVSTHGTTADNPHLPQHIRERLYLKYKGTALEAQELEGRVVEVVEGALWHPDLIHAYRELDVTPVLARRVLGIDPSVSGERTSDECGLVVAGVRDLDLPLSEFAPIAPALIPEAEEYEHEALESLAAEEGGETRLSRQAWILADASGVMGADVWATRAVDLAITWRCGKIVAEVNNGGELVALAIKAECEKRGGVAVKVRRRKPDGTGLGWDWAIELPDGTAFMVCSVWSKESKQLRAEPHAIRYKQGRVHHVGVFADMESEMCTWVPGQESPNRLDALVFALTDLLGGSLADVEMTMSSPVALEDRLPPVGTGVGLLNAVPGSDVWAPPGQQTPGQVLPWTGFRPRGWG
jgi:phage terminase large subunit-like protein